MNSAGIIETRDVEEHREVVQPWELLLRQMSRGPYYGRTEYLSLNGILLYRERCNRRVMGIGETPPGYFLLGGPSTPRTSIDWCGAEIAPGRRAFGRPATEVDFILPEGSDHFALLVPEGLMLEYLGEELGQAVRDRECRHLSCNPALGDELIRMIHRLIDAFLEESDLVANKRVCKAAEWEIMGTLVQILDTGATDARCVSIRRRRLTLLRAIAYAQQLRRPISMPDFAAATGSSKRVLEMAFHEILNVTPVTYLRWSRMHGARRSLLAADEGFARVRQIAALWGFSEPGRFAVEYGRLFGESPSTTLRRSIEPVPKRLADALRA